MILICQHHIAWDQECYQCGEILRVDEWGFVTFIRQLYVPQRLYEWERYQRGECINCGKTRRQSMYKKRCNVCGKARTEWQRKLTGAGKWEKGGRGRPPLARARLLAMARFTGFDGVEEFSEGSDIREDEIDKGEADND